MINRIKELRIQSGLTQSMLAEKSGLSLRTIQRLESSNQAPKGHSLSALATSFEMDPVEFTQSFNTPSPEMSPDSNEAQINHIKLINLSVLICFILPYGNLILPYYLWTKQKGKAIIDASFKRIISFQIIWTLALIILLSCSPFLDDRTGPIPLILIVLFVMYVINLLVVGYTARQLNQGEDQVLNLPIRLI